MAAPMNAIAIKVFVLLVTVYQCYSIPLPVVINTWPFTNATLAGIKKALLVSDSKMYLFLYALKLQSLQFTGLERFETQMWAHKFEDKSRFATLYHIKICIADF